MLENYKVLLHFKAISLIVNDLDGNYSNSIELFAIRDSVKWASDYVINAGYNYSVNDVTYGSTNFALRTLRPWRGSWMGGIHKVERNETVMRLIRDSVSKTILPPNGHKFRFTCVPLPERPSFGSSVERITVVSDEVAFDKVTNYQTGEEVALNESRFEKFMKELEKHRI